MPVLPSRVAGGAQSLQFLVAGLHGIPKSRFFGLIQETHLAASINAGPIDTADGVIRQFTGLDRTPEYAGKGKQIPQDGCGTAALTQTPGFPRLDALNGDGRKGLFVPGSEESLQFLEGVGRCARAAGVDPGCVGVGNEHAQCHAIGALDAM